ncbi:hypothetical protein ACIQF6_19905 [Kitasatospora sp. NPDC092948]|uniref:hypothetical protein n=1 Tax=Kitasatospora sp. NPDC092948 TaxID=3364088 RepID=UPI003801A26A
MSVPLGTIVATMYKFEDLPDGWLPCDGTEIPPKYQELITLLSSTTTPNLIGRTLIGAGDPAKGSTKQTDGRDPAFATLHGALQIGNTGGEAQHQLSIDEMPRHWHTINDGKFWRHYRSFSGEDGDDWPFKDAQGNGGTHTEGTDQEGQGNPHYNVQPYFSVTYMIRAENG